MLPQNHYQLMAQYNLWMDEKVYDLCATIPEELRKRDLGAFFKSIHGTLNHILFGDLAWFQRFIGETLVTQGIGVDLYEDFEALRDAQLKVDHDILDWANQLTDDWLQGTMRYQSRAYQKTWLMPRWVCVSHMFNHATHHRGQLTTLLTQQGYDIGPTDIPVLPVLAHYAQSTS